MKLKTELESFLKEQLRFFLKHTEEWHLYANEVNYDEAGIWVHNDDEYPFHFTVVKKGGEVVIEYI